MENRGGSEGFFLTHGLLVIPKAAKMHKEIVCLLFKREAQQKDAWESVSYQNMCTQWPLAYQAENSTLEKKKTKIDYTFM